MNRHSSLFRVAFITLLMSISFPLLIFLAAQVRHRQLKATSSPRWAQFSAVNGATPAADATLSIPNAIQSNVAKSNVPDKGARAADSHRIQTRTASRTTGFTGSANGNLGNNPAPRVAEAVTMDLALDDRAVRQDQAHRQPQVPGELSRQQTMARPPAKPSNLVPPPDDLPDDIPQPSVSVRLATTPKVEFRTLDESQNAPETSSSRIEARLAGMQQRLDQLAQVQVDKQMSDLDRALNMLQQVQKAQQGPQGQPLSPDDLLRQIQSGTLPSRRAETGLPAPANPQTPFQPATPAPPVPQAVPGSDRSGTAASSQSSSGREPSIKIVQGDKGDDDERFSIQVQEANLTEVLEMLGQLAGVNILASRDVQGRVSLNLQDVTVDRALDAILKSQGYVHEREGDFVYVRSTAEALAVKQASRKLVTKVYQLNYINASEVQKLIDPVLTVGLGRMAVTSPSQVGITPSPTTAGGDGLSQRDTLLVQDYPEVIAAVDKVLIEIDVPPLQVMIEAKILSVALSDSMAFGVNFAMLNGAQNSQVLSGNGSTLTGAVGFPATASLVPAAGDFIANTAGLKYGFIQGDVSGFIKALETIADTTLVAAPQLRVLNKQKAELIIGERLSYKTLAFNGNQTVENVQFLDAGTKLVFRPFISPDGLVRLEVHPERSRATINESTGLPNSETTEVTTNVMVRDGTTVVLGGLISEESTESIDRVPFLGAIPWVGAAFRNKTERVARNEMIVLITPRIVTEPEAAIEGERLQFETESRAAHFRDSLSIVNRTSLTRAHYERACLYFEQGNLLKAKQQVEAALLQNKGDLECQKLKLKIDQSLRDQQSKAWRWPGANVRAAQR